MVISTSSQAYRMPGFIRFVLYFEAVFINLGVGLVCFFWPGWFASNFSTEALPAVSLEMIRWYGVLLCVLAFAVLRMFNRRNLPGILVLVEALLFGDIIHFIASLLYLRLGEPLNLSIIFMFVMTIFLAAVRTSWLIQVRRTRGNLPTTYNPDPVEEDR